MRWPGEAAGPWQGWLAGPQRRWGLLCLQGLPARPPTPATGRGWTDARASSTHLCMGPRLRSQKPLPTEAPGRRPSAVTPLGQLGPATGPSPRLKPRREERAALMHTAGRTPRPSSQTGGNTRPDSTPDSVTSGGRAAGTAQGAGRAAGGELEGPAPRSGHLSHTHLFATSQHRAHSHPCPRALGSIAPVLQKTVTRVGGRGRQGRGRRA